MTDALDHFKTVPTKTTTQIDYILLDGSSSMHYSEVPTDYIQWLMDDTKKKLAEYERELDLRKNKAEDSWMNRIVERGYQSLLVLDDKAVDHTKLERAYKSLKAAIADAAEPKGS